jgi:NADH-quinone oxidoreductase subunit M
MIALLFLIITFVCGLLAWIFGSLSRTFSRLICFAGLAGDAFLVIFVWIARYGIIKSSSKQWISEFNVHWIKPLGISIHLALDGLSLLLAALTVVLGIISVAASWREINNKVGKFHFALMSSLTGILGVFFAMDLFLFYFFWELMLVPMFFLIGFWGRENSIVPAIKFFIYTQLGGLFMLISILAVYWMTGQNTGDYSFDYSKIQSLSMTGSFLIALGFFAAFAVKLPMVPFHLWLPDSYTVAPTAGSIVLAGLLSKTAAYGMLRFLLPLFYQSVMQMSFVVSILAVIGIIYGATTAFAQTDIKRLIAYTSVSHLGFVLFGIFSGNRMAIQGAIVIMLAHGLSTGSLFFITGSLQQRIGTFDMTKMNGLWTRIPRMGAMTLFFALASLGLPGLANFVGEFLVLAGTFSVHPWLTGFATFVFVFSTIYAVWFIFKVFQGQVEKEWNIKDLRFGEMLNLSMTIIGIIWIGIFPQTVFNTANKAVQRIQNTESAAIHKDDSGFDNMINASTELEIREQLHEHIRS